MEVMVGAGPGRDAFWEVRVRGGGRMEHAIRSSTTHKITYRVEDDVPAELERGEEELLGRLPKHKQQND